jgi:hypothetical protein
MVARRLGLQNDMTAFLMKLVVTVMFAKQLDQLRTAKVARQLHAPARSSSRTRCRRTAAGLGWSKK